MAGEASNKLSSVIYFYKKLKYRTSLLDDEKSKANFKIHQKYLSPINMLLLMVYIIIIPFLETPMWCLKRLKESEGFERGSVRLHCEDMGVPFSGNPTLSPVFIAFLDFTCLSYFVFIRWFKTKWRRDSRKDRIQNIILAISVSCIVIDSTIAMILFTKPFVTCIMRPIVFGSFIHLMR